jgi:hypothetical protein
MKHYKKETAKVIIKVDTVPIGHQSHITGTGAHDKRPRRQRTRQGQKRSWQND